MSPLHPLGDHRRDNLGSDHSRVTRFMNELLDELDKLLRIADVHRKVTERIMQMSQIPKDNTNTVAEVTDSIRREDRDALERLGQQVAELRNQL